MKNFNDFKNKIVGLSKTKKGKKIIAHLYSFAKTYVTVFLGIILADTSRMYDWNYIKTALSVSLVSVLRNFYKLLTEK